jgi:hypothetical protein
MNILLSLWVFVVSEFPEIYNFSNFTRDGILRVAFDPYLSVFGNFTWGIIAGFIGAAIYVNERSIGTLAIYLILTGVFMSIVFRGPAAVLSGLFGIFLAVLLAVIFFKAFVQDNT